MDEKYCLKEDPHSNPFVLNHPAVRQIAKELTDEHIDVFARGQCYIPSSNESLYGGYITEYAFRKVCIMLRDERAAKERLRKKSRTRCVLLSILCVFLAVFSIWSYTSYKSAESKIVELNADKSGLLAEVQGLTEYNERVDRKFAEYKEKVDDEYNFFHEYAVITTTAGEKYHEYGCYHIEDRSFYIFNISAAKSKGYEPCKDCIGK